MSLFILGVEQREGKTGPFYVFKLSDNSEPTSFDKDGILRKKASAFMGQPISVKLETRGRYTNLVDIGPPGAYEALAANTPQTTSTTLETRYTKPVDIGMSPEREQKIVRQSSFSTAFNFVGSLYQGAGPEALEEAAGQAIALADRLYGIVFTNPQGPNATPEQVAGLVNAELPGAVQKGAAALVNWG